MFTLARRFTLAAATVLLAAVAPSQAQAQDVMEIQTDSAIAMMSARGFQMKQFRVGGLAEGAGRDFTLTMPAGKTGIIMAVCDGDCSDLDIKVTSGSRQLGQDIEPDDAPVVGIENYSGPMTVRVEMAACSVAPCGFRMMFFVN